MVRSWSPTAVGALALAAALTVSLTAPSTGAATEPSGTEEPGTSTIKIVSYNAGAKVGVSGAMEDLERIMATDPDVITLQEMSSGKKRQAIRETYLNCDTCVWDAYMPGDYPEYEDGNAVKAGTPILYRSDRFELKEGATKQVTERTWVGSDGAGPTYIQPKYVNWVWLKDLRSYRSVHVLNNHTVPSVQGSNGGPNRSNPERLAIYRKHMTGLQELVRTINVDVPRGLSFVSGDLNVNYRRDKVLQPTLFPYRRLGDVGMRANYWALGEPRIGTHTLDNGNGTRLIDYVYFTPRSPLTPVDQKIMRGLNSDHRPIVVTFEVKNRRVAPAPTEDPVL